MIFDTEEERAAWKDDILKFQGSGSGVSGRTQKSSKTFLWQIQRQQLADSTVVTSSFPLLGRISKLSFTIEEKSGRRRSDAEIYSIAKKSNTRLKPMKTGTRGTLGLSVRWNSDVIFVDNVSGQRTKQNRQNKQTIKK